MGDLKWMAIPFGIIIGLGALSVYFYYSLDDAIDYSILHKEITTNQTFVDEMPCSKIIQTRNTLPLINSPKQQDEIEQLKIDFDRLYKEKGCK